MIIEIDHSRTIAADTDSIHHLLLHLDKKIADSEGTIGNLDFDLPKNNVDSLRNIDVAARSSTDPDAKTDRSLDYRADDRIPAQFRAHFDRLENRVHSSNRLASTWILLVSSSNDRRERSSRASWIVEGDDRAWVVLIGRKDRESRVVWETQASSWVQRSRW